MIIPIVTSAFVLLGLIGFIFLFYAVWRMMKSTQSIEKLIKIIEQNIKLTQDDSRSR